MARRGNGIGGPNAEFCLALALKLDGAPGVYAIACNTAGVDGAAEVAGALVSPGTLNDARAAGVSPEALLAANDAHSFFSKVSGQVISGTTLTNEIDFRAILILPPTPQDGGTGSVVRKTDKGYGFIRPDDGGKDVFFHAQNVVDGLFDELTEEEKVTYDVENGPKGPAATNVRRA